MNRYIFSLRGRRLKRKGEGVWGARELRGVRKPKNPTKSMNSHQKTQEYIKGNSPLYIL